MPPRSLWQNKNGYVRVDHGATSNCEIRSMRSVDQHHTVRVPICKSMRNKNPILSVHARTLFYRTRTVFDRTRSTRSESCPPGSCGRKSNSKSRGESDDRESSKESRRKLKRFATRDTSEDHEEQCQNSNRRFRRSVQTQRGQRSEYQSIDSWKRNTEETRRRLPLGAREHNPHLREKQLSQNISTRASVRKTSPACTLALFSYCATHPNTACQKYSKMRLSPSQT